MRPTRSGFTLMELAVVVAVMGLLVGVAFPRIQQVRDIYDVIEASEQVAADLRWARVEARRRNRAVFFRPVPNGRTYTMDLMNITVTTKVQGNKTVTTTDTSYTTLTSRSFPNDTKLINAAAATIQFNPFGPARVNATTAPAQTVLSVSGDAQTRTLIFTPLGDVIVQ